MAIEGEPETIVRTPTERTWRVEIFCEAFKALAAREVRFHRGIVRHLANGEMDGDETPIGLVTRTYSQIEGDTITAAGATVTVPQLMELIAAAGDKYRQQDIDAQTPPPEEPEGEA